MAAALVLGAVLSSQGRWHALAPVSTALGYAMAACLAMFGLAQSLPPLRARFGAIERGFYLFAITWCAVFASRLRRGRPLATLAHITGTDVTIDGDLSPTR